MKQLESSWAGVLQVRKTVSNNYKKWHFLTLLGSEQEFVQGSVPFSSSVLTCLKTCTRCYYDCLRHSHKSLYVFAVLVATGAVWFLSGWFPPLCKLCFPWILTSFQSLLSVRICATRTGLFAYLREANTAGTNSFFLISRSTCENIFGHVPSALPFLMDTCTEMWKKSILLFQ